MHKDTVLGINSDIAVDAKDGHFVALRQSQYNQEYYFGPTEMPLLL